MYSFIRGAACAWAAPHPQNYLEDYEYQIVELDGIKLIILSCILLLKNCEMQY